MIRWSADADDCILMIKRDKTHVRRDPSIVSSNLTNPTFHKVISESRRHRVCGGFRQVSLSFVIQCQRYKQYLCYIQYQPPG